VTKRLQGRLHALTLHARGSYRASRMKVLPIALLLAGLALAGYAGDEEAVLALDHEMAVATWTADLEWFEHNVDAGFVLTTASGRMRTKSDVLAELSAPNMRMEPYEPSEVQVRVFGTTAIVTGRAWQRYTTHEQRYEADLRYTDVWVKKKNKWTLVATHASAIPRRKHP
jgi:hypothetical protein